MQNVFPGALTRIDTTPIVPLGTVAEGPNGDQYIYLQGLTTTVRGTAVVFAAGFTTVLAGSATRGPVGFAMAAVPSNQFGWYQTSGRAPARTLTAVVANLPLYATGTAGSVDDAVVAGALIAGAFTVTVGGVNADATVQISNPFMSGIG